MDAILNKHETTLFWLCDTGISMGIASRADRYPTFDQT